MVDQAEKEYMDARIFDLQRQIDKLQDDFRSAVVDYEKRVNEKFAAKDKADEATTSAMEKRLEGMNEFRRQIDTMVVSLATKDMLAAVEKSFREQVDMLMKTLVQDIRPLQDKRVFDSGGLWVIGGVLSFVGFITMIILTLMHKV